MGGDSDDGGMMLNFAVSAPKRPAKKGRLNSKAQSFKKIARAEAVRFRGCPCGPMHRQPSQVFRDSTHLVTVLNPKQRERVHARKFLPRLIVSAMSGSN